MLNMTEKSCCLLGPDMVGRGLIWLVSGSGLDWLVGA